VICITTMNITVCNFGVCRSNVVSFLLSNQGRLIKSLLETD
jgi:hypothetical protein